MSGGGGQYVPETPLQKEQANIAMQQWDDYNARWLPVIEYYNKRTEGNLGAKKLYAEGEANADTLGKFSNAQDSITRAMAARGDEAGSPGSVFRREELTGDEDTALGMAKSGAEDAIERQYRAGLGDIIQMGRGQRATSDQSLADLSNLSGQMATANAEAAAQDAAGTGQAIGTGIGTFGGYGLRAALAQQNQPPPPARTFSPDISSGAAYMNTTPAIGQDPTQGWAVPGL